MIQYCPGPFFKAIRRDYYQLEDENHAQALVSAKEGEKDAFSPMAARIAVSSNFVVVVGVLSYT